MDKQALAKYLDLANHHPDATEKDIRDLCQKVKKYGFHSAFVNPCYVSLVKQLIDKAVVGTVVAFPLGQETKDIKVLQAITALSKGADELDVSANIGLFKAGQQKLFLEELETIVGVVKDKKPKALVKFIIETGLLNENEIKEISQLVLKSGADFIKTSSGLGPRGASLQDVKIIKSVVGDKIKNKAAGGIDTLEEALDFIKEGVDRIGTSKADKIVDEY